MLTRIQKWGNSLAVRIPRVIAEDMNLAEGTDVEMTVRKGKIVIASPKKKKYRLDDLLGKVSDDNLHDEVKAPHTAEKESV